MSSHRSVIAFQNIDWIQHYHIAVVEAVEFLWGGKEGKRRGGVEGGATWLILVENVCLSNLILSCIYIFLETGSRMIILTDLISELESARICMHRLGFSQYRKVELEIIFDQCFVCKCS